MLPPQDLQQSLAGNEVQLVAGSDGGARVIHNAVPAAAFRPNLATSEQEHFHQVRRKVVYVAAVLGGFVILQHVIAFVFNMAEIEAAINEIREVAPKDLNLHWLPKAGKLIMGGIPSMIWGLFCALMVPLCGYIGARQGNSKLMCCFCGCNFLGSCVGILSAISLVFGLLVMSGIEPVVMDFLEVCDPARCTQAVPALSQNQTIDCLAAPAPRYIMKYSEIPHLPEKCPPLFLTCKIDPAWRRFCESKYDAHSCKGSSSSKCFWIEDSCIPSDQSAIAEKLLHEHPEKHGRYLMSAPMHAWRDLDHDAYYKAGKGVWGQSKNYGPMMPADGEEDDFQRPAIHSPWELPSDPQASCRVDDKRLQSYAAVKKLAPRLLPMLTAVVLMKLLLTVPAIILSCLGFCWGKDLYNKISSGYAHINAPSYVGQPIFIQPSGQPIVPGHGAPAPFAVMMQPMPVQGVPVQGMPVQGVPVASAPPPAS